MATTWNAGSMPPYKSMESKINNRKYLPINEAMNKCKAILKQMENVICSNLQELIVGWNAIESVEEIGRVYFPQLKDISIGKSEKYLAYNNINKVTGFKKLIWPSISSISICNNGK